MKTVENIIKNVEYINILDKILAINSHFFIGMNYKDPFIKLSLEIVRYGDKFNREIDEDIKEDKKWLDIAKQKSDPNCMYTQCLYGLYEKYSGNYEKALEHFIKSIEMGYKDCIKFIMWKYCTGMRSDKTDDFHTVFNDANYRSVIDIINRFDRDDIKNILDSKWFVVHGCFRKYGN